MSLDIRKNDKVYFPGLNALRFFAALAVMLTHMEFMKMKLGMEHSWNEAFFYQAGNLGVYFFFVLSGFLITYLLLFEKEKKSIAIRKFYIRRILRIWPLYYFILILGFFIFPQFEFFQQKYFSQQFETNYWSNFLMYLIILPNLAFSFFTAVPLIGQSWSIGVEEQFYLFWPILMKYTKKPLKMIIWVFGIWLGIKASFLLVVTKFPEPAILQGIKRFLAMSRIELMMIGALGAYLVYVDRKKILSLVYKPIVQVICLLAIPAMIFYFPERFHDGVHLIYGVVFLAIIINISTNKNSWIKLENKTMNFLGAISYGIYMYHLIIIFIVVKLMKTYLSVDRFGLFENIIAYTLSIGFTILISHVSYCYFEKIFLKKKEKFTEIKSGYSVLEEK